MSDKHKNLCMRCIKVDTMTMLTGYCLTSCRCEGCGNVCDLAMVALKDGRDPWVEEQEAAIARRNAAREAAKVECAKARMVKATLTVRGVPHAWTFDWNDRESVRRFAADSNVCILAGGTTHVEPA